MSEFDVAVVHDFFVDRLVHSRDVSELASAIGKKAAAGGGGIHDVRQSEIRGGNAVNLASALARLGLRTLLVTHSDPEHLDLLRSGFAGTRAVLRVKRSPPGLTVAFEGEVNVMLGHLGGAGDFPPEMLDEGDWDALKSSGLVCSVNWAANAKGTRLLAGLRSRLGAKKRIFLNPADVRDRLDRLPSLLDAVRGGAADWVSLNEFEAASFAAALGVTARSGKRLCAGLAERLGTRVDLHTERATFTSSGGAVSVAACKRIRPLKLTGAGDVWDAASIYGDLDGMSDGERLRFANAAARLYVGSEGASPPTLGQIEAEL